MPTPVDIIDALSSPPFATLQLVLDTSGPYGPGDHTLTQFTTNGAFLLPAGAYPLSGTYGFMTSVNGSIPGAAGFKIGWSDPSSVYVENEFFDPIAQVVIQRNSAIGLSPWTTIEKDWVVSIRQTFLLTLLIGAGLRVGLHVEPNWHLDLFYFCVL